MNHSAGALQAPEHLVSCTPGAHTFHCVHVGACLCKTYASWIATISSIRMMRSIHHNSGVHVWKLCKWASSGVPFQATTYGRLRTGRPIPLQKLCKLGSIQSVGGSSQPSTARASSGTPSSRALPNGPEALRNNSPTAETSGQDILNDGAPCAANLNEPVLDLPALETGQKSSESYIACIPSNRTTNFTLCKTEVALCRSNVTPEN